MTRELVALLDGRPVGTLTQATTGLLSFSYDDGWRESDSAYPLSLSMPLIVPEHEHTAVAAFVWGLLPDNDRIIARWAQRFGVSPRNPFGLIAHVGEDLAGAVQFVRRDQLDDVRANRRHAMAIVWLSEAQIAGRLRELRSDHAAWRSATDPGQFSLAGAQPKTALYYDGARWGIPAGSVPTTHIIKPPLNGLAGFAENEHLSLELAGALGLPAVQSRVQWFEDQPAIVITRYDRRRTSDSWRRIHQEDFCQALAIMPTRKYQNEGGPGATAIVEVLRTYSADPARDVEAFVDALGFSWLTGGTDAHAKNYSLLFSAGGRVRLAPLYDLASLLPYPDFDPRVAKLAMRIGREYRITKIGAGSWSRLARDLRLEPEAVRNRLVRMAEQIPDLVTDVRQRAGDQGLSDPLMARYADRVAARAVTCATHLRG